MNKYFLQLVMLLPLLITQTSLASVEVVDSQWNILVGAGQSHPGWGKTSKRVKTHDLVLQRERAQQIEHGKDWYKYRRSVLLEFPLHLVRSPYSSFMVGVNAYSKWTLTAYNKVQPYVLVGGGGLYTNADIPGTSSKIRGTYGAGLGLQLKVDKDFNYFVESRFHHVSNGGLKEPNDPLNSHKVYFGIRLNY